MSEQFIRVYKYMDVSEIKQNLLVYGDISGSCAKCNAISVKLDSVECPECKTKFNYISFRNIKSHLPKLPRVLGEKPYLAIIDFEDYSRNMGKSKAEGLFK